MRVSDFYENTPDNTGLPPLAPTRKETDTMPEETDAQIGDAPVRDLQADMTEVTEEAEVTEATDSQPIEATAEPVADVAASTKKGRKKTERVVLEPVTTEENAADNAANDTANDADNDATIGLLDSDASAEVTADAPALPPRKTRVAKPVETDTDAQISARTTAFGKQGEGDELTADAPFRPSRTGIEQPEYLNALGLKSTESHRHIAEAWQKRCIPISKLRDTVGDYADRTRDDASVPYKTLRMKVNGEGEVVMTDNHHLTPFGMVSAFDFAGLRQATLKDLGDERWGGKFNPVIADMFNEAMKRMPTESEKTAIVRYRTVPAPDGSGDREKVRAVRNGSFVVLDNEAALQMVMNAIPVEGHGETLASHAMLNGDDMIVNLLPPDTVKSRPDSAYGIGVSLSNSEVGNGPLKVEPFLFRAICYNGCIWGRRDASVEDGVVIQRHSGVVEIEALQQKINTAVRAALTEGASLLTQFDHARTVKVASPESLVTYLANQHGLTLDQGRAWFSGYQETVLDEETTAEVKGTLFGVIQGLTLAAQKFPGEQRNRMERLGGSILATRLNDGIEEMRTRMAEMNGYAQSLPVTQIDRYLFGKLDLNGVPGLSTNTMSDIQTGQLQLAG